MSTFPLDVDIIKTKTIENKGITVYFDKEDVYLDFEEKEYYMDLSFLEI